MTTLVFQRGLPQGQKIRIIHGDITESNVDAIVNAANAQLKHGGGVAGAIVRRGGPQIQIESDEWVRQYGPVTHEQPAITSAGRLPCRHVIHAVGPIWGQGREDQKLLDTVNGVLILARDLNLASLALPAISTGIFRFPKERAARLIIDAIMDFYHRNPNSLLMTVDLMLFDEPSVNTFVVECERRWPTNCDSK
ncbi:MAG TPA: macro domain-containing protein [Anaerolineales bacterium]|nr:macro domain-containing protein [Anaerolineales bacterium]HUS83642.1 macro domain-containing protein [Anaerolineales bacterium]